MQQINKAKRAAQVGRHYMFVYLEGVPGGSDSEKLDKKAIKSHRRIYEVSKVSRFCIFIVLAEIKKTLY